MNRTNVSVNVFRIRTQVPGSKEPRRHDPVLQCHMDLVMPGTKPDGKAVVERLNKLLGVPGGDTDFNYRFTFQ